MDGSQSPTLRNIERGQGEPTLGGRWQASDARCDAPTRTME